MFVSPTGFYKKSFNPRTHVGATPLMYAKKLANQFQSTHPHGVRLCSCKILHGRLLFQSTHPHGVRHSVVYRVLNTHTFQSTHPHGVRQRNNAVVFIPNEFQSTHPHGVRQPGKTGQNRPKKFQSTHPHGVRLRRRRRGGRGSPVSIHAPTWGATMYFLKYSECHSVSIHAPTWGATKVVVPCCLYHRRFNPRTHMGCDC